MKKSRDILDVDLSKLAKKSAKPKGEALLVKSAIKYLNSLPMAYAEKRQATAGKKGRPDITGCIEGRRLELEAKVGNNKPTKIQLHWLEKWKKVGAITGVFWSIDDLKNILCQHGILSR